MVKCIKYLCNYPNGGLEGGSLPKLGVLRLRCRGHQKTTLCSSNIPAQHCIMHATNLHQSTKLALPAPCLESLGHTVLIVLQNELSCIGLQSRGLRTGAYIHFCHLFRQETLCSSFFSPPNTCRCRACVIKESKKQPHLATHPPTYLRWVCVLIRLWVGAAAIKES